MVSRLPPLGLLRVRARPAGTPAFWGEHRGPHGGRDGRAGSSLGKPSSSRGRGRGEADPGGGWAALPVPSGSEWLQVGRALAATSRGDARPRVGDSLITAQRGHHGSAACAQGPCIIVLAAEDGVRDVTTDPHQARGWDLRAGLLFASSQVRGRRRRETHCALVLRGFTFRESTAKRGSSRRMGFRGVVVEAV